MALILFTSACPGDHIEHFKRGTWTEKKATPVIHLSHSFILVSGKDMPMIQTLFLKMKMDGDGYSDALLPKL